MKRAKFADMSTNYLESARNFLIYFLQEKQNRIETIHPWRKDWQFAVLHSLRVESYTLKILARENHPISDHEILLLRLAAVLHDIARVENREDHASLGAEIARQWLQSSAGDELAAIDINFVVEMIAEHSNKAAPEQNYCSAVLKDADTLDEIGAMSIFMAGNWLDNESPFYFHELRQRLVEHEIPYCEQKRAILNTAGAKTILDEKKAFIENFIAQISEEINIDEQGENQLIRLSSSSTLGS